MTLPMLTRGQVRVLSALAGGARLSRRDRTTYVLTRGRRRRGVRRSTVVRLQRLLLIRGGLITDAGKLVLAVESC